MKFTWGEDVQYLDVYKNSALLLLIRLVRNGRKNKMGQHSSGPTLHLYHMKHVWYLNFDPRNFMFINMPKTGLAIVLCLTGKSPLQRKNPMSQSLWKEKPERQHVYSYGYNILWMFPATPFYTAVHCATTFEPCMQMRSCPSKIMTWRIWFWSVVKVHLYLWPRAALRS